MKKTMQIDGETWVLQEDGESLQQRIVIVDNRGLTFVCKTDLQRNQDGRITLFDARCIIRWGTKEHLAELADGPLPDTRLGRAAHVTVNDVIVAFDVWGDWS